MVDWLYLDLNSFFASCEQQENPSLRGKPIAVVPMLADSTFCIAASQEAKVFGVKTGVRVGDAKKMCPGLQLMTAHHHIYVKYHHAVIEAVESCIPIHSICSIDEIACELTGSQRNLANAKKIAQKIKSVLKESVGTQISASIGLASNMLLAKIATDMQKPDGLTSIENEELPQKLYSLKLQDIPGIGRRMDARLWAQGIRDIPSLLALDENQMRGVWGGIIGARYFELLKGKNIFYSYSSFGSKEHVQKSIGHEHVLPPKERNYKDAQIVAQKLLSKAAVRLRRSGFMAGHLGLSIRYVNAPSWYSDLRFTAISDSITLIKNLNSMYAQAPKNQKPFKIGIVLSHFSEEKSQQLSFLQNDKLNNLFKVVDKINQRYGRDSVYVGSLHGHIQSAPTRIAFSRIPELDEVSSED